MMRTFLGGEKSFALMPSMNLTENQLLFKATERGGQLEIWLVSWDRSLTTVRLRSRRDPL